MQAPKKDKKEDDEDDKALKERRKAEEAALKAAKEKGMHITGFGEKDILSLLWILSDHGHSCQRYGCIPSPCR